MGAGFNVKRRRELADSAVAGDGASPDVERRLPQCDPWEMALPLRFEDQHVLRGFYETWQASDGTKGNLNGLQVDDCWICSGIASSMPGAVALQSVLRIPRAPVCVQLFEMPIRCCLCRNGRFLWLRPRSRPAARQVQAPSPRSNP